MTPQNQINAIKQEGQNDRCPSYEYCLHKTKDDLCYETWEYCTIRKIHLRKERDAVLRRLKEDWAIMSGEFGV